MGLIFYEGMKERNEGFLLLDGKEGKQEKILIFSPNPWGPIVSRPLPTVSQ